MFVRTLMAAVFLFAAFVTTACAGFPGWTWEAIRGSGKLVSTDYDFNKFDKLSIASAFTVAVKQGDSYAVRVTVDDNLLDRLIVDERGDTLVIEMRPGAVTAGRFEAEITMPKLTGVKLSGATTAAIRGFTGAEALDANLSGASQLAGDLSTTTARLELSGASKLTLRGTAQSVDVKATGASHANLEAFAVESAKADLSGASSALLNVSQTLDASASGASSIAYAGNPAQVNKNTSGASSIKPR